MENERAQSETSTSGSSACSGADARQADKESLGSVECPCCKEDLTLLSDHVCKSAVSPRSSDGLLPCPFCGGDVSMVMWGYSKAGPFDVSIECNCCKISFKHAWGDHKTAWNKRATKSPIETA